MRCRSIVLWLTLLCTLAFAARLGLIIHLKAWQKPNAIEHKSVALSLVHGYGFAFGDWGYFGPSSVQSPPFPFLLAGMYKIFGDQAPANGSLTGANRAYFAIMLLNCLGGAALVGLTYWMTRTMGGGPLAGLLAAAAVAIWPSQVYAARHVQAIVLISVLLVASIILFYRAARSGSLGAWAAFAFIMALAALTEPVFLPMLPICVLLALFWPGPTGVGRLRNGIAVVVLAFVVIGPWSIRNRIVHGQWVPIKASFWVNMWKGNNEFATGTDRLAPSAAALKAGKGDLLSDEDLVDSTLDRDRQYDMLDLSQRSRLHMQPETVREGVFREFAVNWIRDHPGGYIRLCGVRLLKSLTIDWDNPKAYNIFYVISRYLLLGLTVLGLIVAWRQKWSLLFAGLLAGVALLSYTLTVTAARFSIPFEPIQLSLGAGFLAALLHRSGPTAPSSDFEVIVSQRARA